MTDSKADVDALGERYGNAIQAASVNGNTRIVRLLIDDIIEGEYSDSLTAAISKNHKAVIKLLLEEGANQNTN
jgi:ankyrin repeat protein